MKELIDLPTDAQTISLNCVVDDTKTTGTAVRRDFTRAERTRRATRTFTILFVIGLFSVVVPLLHIILPPLFLLAAIGFAVVTFAETSEVVSGEVSCPNCRKDIHLQRESEEWPKVLRCPGCSFTLTLTPS